MIDIKNIFFSYNDEMIFDNASLTLPSKGVFLLKGANGSGKSTLLKIIKGELLVKKGNINIANINISKNIKNKKRILDDNITYIDQQNNLIDFLNVKENASLNLIINKQKVTDLKYLKDDQYSNRYVDSLSSGEKIITSFEKVTNENRKIILLDECTDFLDDYNTNLIISIIKELGEKYLIIIVSHDERVIYAFDKIITIENKKIFFDNDSLLIDDEKLYIPDNKKNYSVIIKKILKNNRFLMVFLTFLITIINTFYLTTFSIVTYPFDESYDALIETGFYGLIEKENESIEDIFNIELDYFVPYYKSSFSKENLIKFRDSEFLNNFKFGNYSIINEKKDNFAYISRDDIGYFNEYIDDQYIIFSTVNDTAFKLPYKLVDDTTFSHTADISVNSISNVEFIKPIKIYGALWENNLIDFESKQGLKNLVTETGVVSFMSPSIFKQKYNQELDFEISDRDIYISSYLNKYYVDGQVHFYEYNDKKMGIYGSFINVYDILNQSTLIKNNKIQSLLQNNEVLISENNFNKIASRLNLYGTPYTFVSNKNRDSFIKFKNQNDLDFVEYSIESSINYSKKDFSAFQLLYSQNLEVILTAIFSIFIFEISILYVINNSLIESQKRNIIILNRYYNRIQVSYLYCSIFVVPMIVSILSSLLLAKMILEYIFDRLDFKILQLNLNVYSILLMISVNLIVLVFDLMIKFKVNLNDRK